MKKMIFVVMACALMLSGCGNMSVGFGNYTYHKVHVDTHNYSGCFTIDMWHDSDTGIEVDTKEAGSMFLSEGVYVLIEDECPFCGE